MQRSAVFAVLVALGLVAPTAHAQQWGTIKGRITWGPKEIPVQAPIAAINNHADKAQCLIKGPVLNEEWVVNPKNRGVQWVLLWLIHDDPKDKTPLPVNPAAVKKAAPTVDQPACAFIPHTVAVMDGQDLLVKNSSAIPHNVKWTSKDNNGNVLIPAGGSYKIKDLKAQRVPMKIECSIHPWMYAWVGIYDHPYFAVTDADGNFTIQNAPAGKFRLVVYDNVYNGGAPGRFGQPITIAPNAVTDLGSIDFVPPKE